jgi:hypothetical protein
MGFIDGLFPVFRAENDLIKYLAIGTHRLFWDVVQKI